MSHSPLSEFSTFSGPAWEEALLRIICSIGMLGAFGCLCLWLYFFPKPSVLTRFVTSLMNEFKTADALKGAWRQKKKIQTWDLKWPKMCCKKIYDHNFHQVISFLLSNALLYRPSLASMVSSEKHTRTITSENSCLEYSHPRKSEI